jgi:hypothetical protein
VLRLVRDRLPPGGSVCAWIPNAQHCSLQARLCLGQFVDEENGLLDRTHRHWFTPSTMEILLADSGLRIIHQQPRIFPHLAEALLWEHICAFAQQLGGDLDQAVGDAVRRQLDRRDRATT